MQGRETSSGLARDDDVVNENENDTTNQKEEYKRALLVLLKEVMHPPEFTPGEITGHFAWCIHVNKLLRDLKTLADAIGPGDVPQSFEDLDAFVKEAWQIAVMEGTPDFYAKWPRDLDRRVEEAFKDGVPLGRMMIPVVTGGGENSGLVRQGESEGHVRSPLRRNRHGSAAAAGSAVGYHMGVSPSAAAAAVTPSTPTPQTTPSLDSRVLSSDTDSTGRRPLSLSPSRRFSMVEFEQLIQNKDKYSKSQNQNQNAHRAEHLSPPPPPLESTASSSTIILNPTPTPTHNRSTTPPLIPPPADVEQSTSEHGESLRRSPSERPWIPQSYRDGSMPADLAELFSKLDEVCEAADALIVEAEDIDALDMGETRLRGWTSRARKCEINGRKVLTHIFSTGLSESEEVLYVSSTLRLLKSAHVELCEYADSTLSSEPAGAARREATVALQPAIRNSIGADTPSVVSCNTPLETRAELPVGRGRGLERESEHPGGPSRPRPTARRRLIPYVLIPSVPWRWRTASPEPEPEFEPKPNRSLLPTESIVIRTRRVSGPPGSSTDTGNQTHHTIKLQRMTDREPNDLEHAPPCSECASLGFSCFGKPGNQSVCRRCKRVRKGRCTYARPRGGWGAMEKEMQGKGNGKGKGKGKAKEIRIQVKEDARANDKTLKRGTKRKASKRNSGALDKLREARARLERGKRVKQQQRKGKNKQTSDSEEDSDSDRATDDEEQSGEGTSDNDSDAGPPFKRQRSASARATHEPEGFGHESVGRCPQAVVPVRATTEPPDHPLGALGTRSLRSQSRRPRLASLARSSSPPISYEVSILDENWNEGFYGPEGDDSIMMGLDSRTTLGSEFEPEPEPERVSREAGTGSHTEDRNDVEKDTPLEPEGDPLYEQPTPEALQIGFPISVRAPVVPAFPASLSSPSTSQSPASIGDPIPTPISSPSDQHLSFPQVSQSSTALTPTQTPNPNHLLIASLTEKLDTLIASQEALTAEVRSAQAKLTLQAGVIEEVREALRTLKASAGTNLDVSF